MPECPTFHHTRRDIFQVHNNVLNPVPFTTLADCGDDHSGITFDHQGTFGYNMIVTCQDGPVWEIDGHGNAIGGVLPGDPIANLGTEIEGPGVAATNFGFYAGFLLVADETGGWVHAISPVAPLHPVTLNCLQRAPRGKHPGHPAGFRAPSARVAAFFQALPFGNGGP